MLIKPNIISPVRLMARGMAYDAARPSRSRSNPDPSLDQSRPVVKPRQRTQHNPPHLLTLADLSPDQISSLLVSSLTFKTICNLVKFVIISDMSVTTKESNGSVPGYITDGLEDGIRLG